MGWIEIMMALYALIATGGLTMTLREQVQQGRRGLLLRLASYAACTLWPFTLAAVLIEARRRGV